GQDVPLIRQDHAGPAAVTGADLHHAGAYLRGDARQRRVVQLRRIHHGDRAATLVGVGLGVDPRARRSAAHRGDRHQQEDQQSDTEDPATLTVGPATVAGRNALAAVGWLAGVRLARVRRLAAVGRLAG